MEKTDKCCRVHYVPVTQNCFVFVQQRRCNFIVIGDQYIIEEGDILALFIEHETEPLVVGNICLVEVEKSYHNPAQSVCEVNIKKIDHAQEELR